MKQLTKKAARSIGFMLGLSALMMWMMMSMSGPAMRTASAISKQNGDSAGKSAQRQSRQSARGADLPALSISDIKIIGAGHFSRASASGDMAIISIASAGWQPGETVEVSIYKAGASVPDATFNLVADEKGRLINTKLMLSSSTTGPRQMVAVGRESEKFASKKFQIMDVNGGPFVNTYDSSCTTFTTTFALGDTVCAQVTGIDPKVFTARFDWIDPDGIVQEMGPTITANGQTDTFMIPAMGPNAKTGTWRVQITDVNDNSNLASQSFTVITPGPQPEAIATFESDCATPQSSFTGGFTVCAQVTGIDAGEENTFRIDWIRPDSSVAENGPIVTMNNQTDTFAIPASGPEGTWTVQLTRLSDGGAQAQANFFVSVSQCTIICPENTTRSNDPGQCGAVVNYDPPFTQGDCGKITCSPSPGSFFPVGTTTVNCTQSTGKTGMKTLGETKGNVVCTFTITVNDTQAPTINCQSNITQPADPNKCTAVVNYPTPTATDNCPCGKSSNLINGAGSCTVTCNPPSGSTFPVGTTTVTCQATDQAGNKGSCSFTVTVVDTQPPSITCPAGSITTQTASTCPPSSSGVVTFPPPTASDNCPGVTTSCSPASGSAFPVGSTTVTCTARDVSGNTATCSFMVTVFNGCLQDDSNPNIVVLFNTFTGAYRFCCNGTTYTGTGTITKQACVVTIQHNGTDRRVTIKVDFAVKTGSASLQAPPGATRCTITDRNIANNTCNCQ